MENSYILVEKLNLRHFTSELQLFLTVYQRFTIVYDVTMTSRLHFQIILKENVHSADKITQDTKVSILFNLNSTVYNGLQLPY